MEEFTIKALVDDIRKGIGFYLNKSRTDEIIGELLKKYHGGDKYKAISWALQ